MNSAVERTVFACAGILLGFLIAAAVRPVALAEEARALPPLSGKAIERHIEYLASDELEGREAGLPGSEKAERYIVEVLRGAGLDAVEEQPFEFIAGARLGEGNALAIAGQTLPGESFRPLPFSASGEGEWPAVFAGFGIEAPDLGRDDYKGIDAAGKAAVVREGTPDGASPHGRFEPHAGLRAKALKAAEKKARALVVLIAGKEGKLPEFAGEDITRDVGIPVVAVLESAAAPLLGIETAEPAGKSAADDSGPRPLGARLRLRANVILERRTTRNILGWLRGRAPAVLDEAVIIGAHHDHLGRGGSASMARDRRGEIHNGADDNASGVAGIIELARFLAPRASELKRHVLFMTFGAEEKGLLGSKYFKDHPLLRLPAAAAAGERPLKAVAMINLDMVGRLRERRLLVSGAGTSEAWPGLLEAVRESGSHDLVLSMDREEDLFGSSDHTSFYQMGLPVLFFFTGNHPQYHTPEDDLYRREEGGGPGLLINLEGMEQVLRYVADVLVATANRPQPPPFKPGVELAPRAQFKVVLRLLPDYGADVEGMRIAGVTPGGPADRAGIRAGDIIVRFGATPVRSVRDYMVGLEKAKPAEPVEVELRRGEETMVLKIIPQSTSPAAP